MELTFEVLHERRKIDKVIGKITEVVEREGGRVVGADIVAERLVVEVEVDARLPGEVSQMFAAVSSAEPDAAMHLDGWGPAIGRPALVVIVTYYGARWAEIDKVAKTFGGEVGVLPEWQGLVGQSKPTTALVRFPVANGDEARTIYETLKAQFSNGSGVNIREHLLATRVPRQLVELFTLELAQ